MAPFPDPDRSQHEDELRPFSYSFAVNYIDFNAKYLFKTVGASAEDPDPDLQNLHVLGIQDPEPDPLVRGTDLDQGVERTEIMHAK